MGEKTSHRGASGRTECVKMWRKDAETLRLYGCEDAARLLEVVSDQLEMTIASAARERLTLTQAAQESGYSRDHLGRMVQNGQIPNSGKHGAPRIARADLPRKPMASARSEAQLDPEQIVQSVINEGDR